MVAGRSGSAYTAELGSMKMREEIDALHTMGFDPVEVLILPRIVALIIGVPILTFLGSMAALYGGGLVCWLYGGIDPDIFLSRLKEAITLDTFEVGMIKAPFMALVIGVVACVEGLAGQGLRGIARPADHRLGGEVDLPGDRARRPVRHLLRLDRDVSDGAAATAERRRHRGARPGGRLRRPRRARSTSTSTSIAARSSASSAAPAPASRC